MTQRFTEAQVIATVTRLTHQQLARFIEGALIKPQRAQEGYVFLPVDISRLELLCDLALDLELDETALGIIVSLLDQLHVARSELALLARAVEVQPPEVQAHLITAFQQR